MSDDTPGVLYRLDIKDRDGNSIKGYPQILASDREYVQRLSYWMGKSYEKNLGLTFIKEGCTRSAWINLDGPVNHWSSSPGPHREADCLPDVDDPDWPVEQILDEILRP
jgi:hypothetical protein